MVHVAIDDLPLIWSQFINFQKQLLRALQGSGPATGDAASAATDGTLATAAMAPAVLGTPGLVQQLILGHLTLLDKLRLRATCSALRHASPAWFAQATVVVKLTGAAGAALATWLRQHSGKLTFLELPMYCGFAATGDVASLWQLTALRRLRLGYWRCDGSWRGMAALRQLQHLELYLDRRGMIMHNGRRPYQDLSASLSALTCLTFLKLELETSDNVSPPLPAGDAVCYQHLQPLGRLQRLRLVNTGGGADVAAALPSLTALTHLHCTAPPGAAPVDWQHLGWAAELQELTLDHCYIRRLPGALSSLAALTSLRIINDNLSGLEPLSALHQLQELELIRCRLAAVPDQLSALTALTWLSLGYNRSLVGGGWEHLLPLTRLRTLRLEDVPLPAGVHPEVVEKLPAAERVQLLAAAARAGAATAVF
ncbi:hypothetical protein CHLNCDRAFT_139801 [Chlorella variabilis]|uniref:F-box domain-containing protein n=1 Tax=Chlorella variabilis TaxID=554065 RepID=E1ZR01_CHLVA|nr:hypothetical protein CHLNCDRAFT_139801 [Chlorella variabilis]EFN51878.1 hypothetical protein CHLNCDRAFT_139801 [Chlorella variabilis]|eukprot:XP_005843980.1 hypothetical protein CHLNCDRAFT_139801 [Chlorella variabilis]